jgi:MFS family permease
MSRVLGRSWPALLLLTVVELMVFLDTTVVNVAMPSIGRGLHLAESSLAWVAGAYQLTFGGFQLIGGRAADLLGRRRVFVAGVAIFTGASLLAGLAAWPWLLLTARALQGLGAAIVVPAEISLLAVTFTEPRAYARAFGVWSAMGAAGAAAGSVLGGVLTQGLGWPSIFLVNLPIGVAALALTGRLLPRDVAPDRDGLRDGGGLAPEPGGSRWRRLDLPGALAGTTALILVVYGVTAAAVHGFDARTTSALLAGVALGVVFCGIEARTTAPMMPLRLYRIRNVSGSAVVNFMIGIAHVPAFVLLALYLQQVQHYGPIASGLAVLPVAIGAVSIARTALPWALARYGAKPVLVTGMTLLGLALAGFARLPLHAHYLTDVLPAGVLLAVGLPACFAGSTIPAVTSVAKADTGIAAGIAQTAQRVGGALGATGATALAAAWTAHYTGSHLAGYAAGIRVAFAAAAATALLGALAALILITTSRPDRESTLVEPAVSLPGRRVAE